MPDPSQFPPLHQPVQPHIFTETEIARLLEAADQLKPGSGSPLRRQTFKLAVVLLYTSGLRRGELLRLVIRDYDRIERTLRVRESKFHKSRLLPLSGDGAQQFELYLMTRRRGVRGRSVQKVPDCNIQDSKQLHATIGTFLRDFRDLL